jgi:hypothetical protein
MHPASLHDRFAEEPRPRDRCPSRQHDLGLDVGGDGEPEPRYGHDGARMARDEVP